MYVVHSWFVSVEYSAERRPGHGRPRDRAELLSSACEKLNPTGPAPVSPLQKDLVGQFKGFSITPIGTNKVSTAQSSVPARPAPAPPAAAAQPRPVISSPVLDDTTSRTVRQMMGGSTPSRPAPPPPSVTSIPVQSATLPRPKPAGNTSLNRIASFIKSKESINAPPKKKIDRERLRTLEISGPIPQTQIDLPSQNATDPEEGPSNVVMRVQSMREGNKPRNVRSFGSMREGKRPSSLTTAVRPTVPPPQPPTQTYDDCLNLLTETNAPLANIDEESPASPHKENIYAVIDETPPSPHYKLPRSLDPLSLTGNDETSESMGLLGEIVSEIEARNNDSIYSASTLKRKKELSPPSEYNTPSEGTDSTYVNTSFKSNSEDCSDSSNSGYLSPVGSKSTEKPVVENSNATKASSTYKPNTPGPQNKPHRDSVSVPPVHKVSSDSKTPSLGLKPFVPPAPEKSNPVDNVCFSPPSSYKPYSSSLQRSAGPFAAAYNKSPSFKPKEMKPAAQLKSTPPHFSEKNVKNHSAVRDDPAKTITGLSSVKPDLVSSCTESDAKSPDVLNKSKGPEVPLKPLAKSNSFKPEIKGSKAEIKVSSKPEVKLKKADIKGKTDGVRTAVSSNVQALQQKFENNKAKTTTVKPILAAKSVASESKMKVGDLKR